MKIKKSVLALALLSAGALSSCSTFSLVDSQVYNNANLADFHTFRIVTPGEGKLPPGMEMVTYYNIAAAIREQMVERGYVEDPASPIVINIGLTVKNEVMTEPLAALAPPPPPPGPMGPPMGPPPPGPNWFPYGGPGPAPGFAPYFMMPRSYYWNPNAQVVTGIYKEGVLTMDIVNIASKEALFSSSVATILENGDAQFRNLTGIAEAVQILFKKYPVPLLPQYRNQKK
ncbi:MAG: DUF4136 domain-containing protein [Muribaculaceae bacterium]|nr:DUF4136 domain-containing protein [Muribaculaceae bacterium]